MKKILATLLVVSTLITSTSALAWNNGYRGGCWNCGRGGWVAPAVAGLVIGSAIGYAAAPRYYSPPVYVQPQPVIIPVQPVYTQQTIYDANCACYRTVLVPQQ